MGSLQERDYEAVSRRTSSAISPLELPPATCRCPPSSRGSSRLLLGSAASSMDPAAVDLPRAVYDVRLHAGDVHDALDIRDSDDVVVGGADGVVVAVGEREAQGAERTRVLEVTINSR
uniref:Uncharacterized protein n=1 Tax=Arundo donax TaxID=35708 RepID=A0A0A9GC45_ARUDO